MLSLAYLKMKIPDQTWVPGLLRQPCILSGSTWSKSPVHQYCFLHSSFLSWALSTGRKIQEMTDWNAIYLPIYLSIHLFIYLSIYLAIYLSIFPSVYLSMDPSIHLSINQVSIFSIHVSAYLSIYVAPQVGLRPAGSLSWHPVAPCASRMDAQLGRRAGGESVAWFYWAGVRNKEHWETLFGWNSQCIFINCFMDDLRLKTLFKFLWKHQRPILVHDSRGVEHASLVGSMIRMIAARQTAAAAGGCCCCCCNQPASKERNQQPHTFFETHPKQQNTT